MVIKEISQVEFYKRYLSYKKIEVIDIRTKEEYICYHLEDSINIPFNKLINEYQSILSKNKQYYLICSDGRKSKYISYILEAEGYNIVSVVGGLRRWKGELVS